MRHLRQIGATSRPRRRGTGERIWDYAHAEMLRELYATDRPRSAIVATHGMATHGLLADSGHVWRRGHTENVASELEFCGGR